MLITYTMCCRPHNTWSYNIVLAKYPRDKSQKDPFLLPYSVYTVVPVVCCWALRSRSELTAVRTRLLPTAHSVPGVPEAPPSSTWCLSHRQPTFGSLWRWLWLQSRTWCADGLSLLFSAETASLGARACEDDLTEQQLRASSGNWSTPSQSPVCPDRATVATPLVHVTNGSLRLL